MNAINTRARAACRRMTDDELWAYMAILHVGHVGMACMLHIMKVWEVEANVDMLKKGLTECRACQKHQHVRREKNFTSLNKASKPWELVALDFIGPLQGKYVLTKN